MEGLEVKDLKSRVDRLGVRKASIGSTGEKGRWIPFVCRRYRYREARYNRCPFPPLQNRKHE